MTEKLKLLHLEDSPADHELIVRELIEAGWDVHPERVETRDAFLERLESWQPDLVVCDYALPMFDGKTALRLVRERAPYIPVIMCTGAVSEEEAVACLKAGASDYVLKHRLISFEPAVRTTLERRREREARYQAEASLRESEAHFRAVAQAAPDAIVSADGRGAILFWNTAAEHLFGYTETDMVGESIASIMPERFRERHRTALERVTRFFDDTARSQVVGTTLDVVGLRSDGTEFPVELTVSAWEVEGEKFYTGVLRDVTLRRAAEEAVRHLASVAHQNPNPVIEVDFDAEVVLANLAAEQHFPDLRSSSAQGNITSSLNEVVTRLQQTGQQWIEREVEVDERTYVQKLCLVPAGDRLRIFSHEITERRAAERAVERLSQQHELLLNSAAEGILGIDGQGRANFVNPAALTITGHTSEDLLGQDVHELLHHSDADGQPIPEDECAIGAALSAGETFQGETTLWRADGQPFPVDLSAVPVQGEGGGSGAVMIFGDITDRRRAEERLRRSEADYRGLVENAIHGICRVTDTQMLTSVNSTLVEMLGYGSKDELEALSADELYGDPDERRKVFSALDDVERIEGLEVEWKRKDGDLIRVRLSGRHVRPGSGIFEMIVEDVTDSTRIARRKELLSAAVEQASDLVVVTDPDGAITYANRAFTQTTGYSVDEVRGHNPRLLKSGAQPPGFYEAMWTQLSEGRPWSAEFVNLKKDGSSFRQKSTVFPVHGESGETLSYVSMGRDVTHERSLEGQLRQSQKMEAVGQLTAGIAHDFNNVLSIISINAELCVEDLEAGVPIEPESLVAVQEATRRAARITEQLLGFSRQAELTVDPVNLGVLVNGMSGLIRTAVPESVALVLQADESVPTVDVDRQSVEQIVLNFVTNGRDAMPDGGCLTVSVREKTIDSLYREAHPDVVPGGYVEIVVTDTGIGMDALTQARIFEPFFTTKSTGSGTGLGMAMAYGLAKQQGGHIQAYSDLGRGTTVRALFPVSKQTGGVARAAHAEPQRRLGTETILLVEDEPAVQAAAAKALERQGYTILSASDGVEGLAAYRAHSESIDLVITDLVMPNMGGRELCAALREADPRLPILVTSGYSGQEAPHGGVDRSIEFLLKPWDLDTLLSTMRGLLDNRPQSRGGGE